MQGIRCFAVAALMLAGLGGCAYAPAPYYGYAPGYAYAPGPYYYGPPVALGFGGCWRCGWGGWGHWR